MIRNMISVRDYETCSRNKYKTQPLSVACVIVDPTRLEIVKDSVFYSLIKPADEKTIAKFGLDQVQDEALKVNKLNLDELQEAPELKVVWEQYLDYLSNYNLKGKNGSKWDAPIVGGYNNSNFDDVIDIQLCERFGPKLDEYGGWSIYHPFANFDVQHLVQNFFFAQRINNNDSISMDAMREYLGISQNNAHNAVKDVIDTAHLLIKFLRLLKNLVNGEIDLPKGKKIKFKNCFAKENKLIDKEVKKWL